MPNAASLSQTRSQLLFVGHGSPMVALSRDAFASALATHAQSRPKPRAAVVFSSEWCTSNVVEITSSERPVQLFDFYGFPEELYKVAYAPAGAPKLAEELRKLLLINGFQVKLNPSRGLDHGAWIPLSLMFPEADVPVVQISLPISLGFQEILLIGRALIDLRGEDLLFFGSGNLVHNPAAMNWPQRTAPPFVWAKVFDEWAMEKITHEPEEFVEVFFKGPNFHDANPSVKHLLPLFALLGLRRLEESPREIFKGFEHSSLSMRTFEWVKRPLRTHARH